MGLFAFVLTLLWIFLLSPWVSVFQGVVERIFLLCLWAPKYRVLLFLFLQPLCLFTALNSLWNSPAQDAGMSATVEVPFCDHLKYVVCVLPTIEKLPLVHKSFKQCKEDCYILVLRACFHRNEANANVIHVCFSFAAKRGFVS